MKRRTIKLGIKSSKNRYELYGIICKDVNDEFITYKRNNNRWIKIQNKYPLIEQHDDLNKFILADISISNIKVLLYKQQLSRHNKFKLRIEPFHGLPYVFSLYIHPYIIEIFGVDDDNSIYIMLWKYERIDCQDIRQRIG